MNLGYFIFLGETLAGEQKRSLKIVQEVESALPTWNAEELPSFPPAKELLLTKLAAT